MIYCYKYVHYYNFGVGVENRLIKHFALNVKLIYQRSKRKRYIYQCGI